MTDWDEMVESIHAAMQAVDKAHVASESLREKTDSEGIKKFQAEMAKLYRHLEQMQRILAHEDTYALDEIANSLSEMLGEGRTYERIEHYDLKQK